METYRLYVDQYNNVIYASSVKDLQEKAGGGRITRMYRDRKDKQYHVGYVVGQRWFSMYQPLEIEVK